MPFECQYDSDEDEEILQLDYDEACDDVVELQRELRAAKIEATQLKLRLKAIAAHASSNPACDSLASSCSDAPADSVPDALPEDMLEVQSDARWEELQNFVVWLAQHICFDQERIFDVNLEVPVAGVTMQMTQVVQWPLTYQLGKRLYFTAPAESRDQLENMLSYTRAEGKMTEDALQTMTAYWNLVPGDLDLVTQHESEPVVMLAQKTAPLCMMVASWPTPEALQDFQSLCSDDGVSYDVADKVEVEYDGKWYVGTLCSLNASGYASINCDADGPDVLTVAPLDCVRAHVAQSLTAGEQNPQPVFADHESPEKVDRRLCSETNLHQPL